MNAPGVFIMDTTRPGITGEGTAIGLYPDYAAASVAHQALETAPSFPDRPWPMCWHYVIQRARGPNDCRADLIAISDAHYAELAA